MNLESKNKIWLSLAMLMNLRKIRKNLICIFRCRDTSGRKHFQVGCTQSEKKLLSRHTLSVLSVFLYFVKTFEFVRGEKH